MEIRPVLPEQDPEQRPAPPAERSRQDRWPVSWWWLTSALAFGLAIGIGVLALVRMLAAPLAILFLAVTIGSALMPVVDWVHRRRIPRTLAVILVYALLLIAGLLGAMVPVIVEQTRALIDQSDEFLPRITGYIEQLGFDQSDLISTITAQFGSAMSYLFRVPLNIASAVAEFILVIFTSLFWVLSAPAAKRFALSFFTGRERGEVERVLGHMGRAMGGYIRGSAINGVLMGAAAYIGLSVIGVPYAAFLAAFAALMEFFPVIGAIAAVALSTLVALTVSIPTALVTLVFGVVLQQVESNIVAPLVIRSQTEIPALIAIFALVAGAAVGGLLGALVAIPLTAALLALVRLVIAPALRRANGAPEKPEA